jgi:hypothetical protein
MRTTPKSAIVESLDEMDNRQARKVLAYIRSLLVQGKEDADYRRFKQEALKEIRQAINREKGFSLSA